MIQYKNDAKGGQLRGSIYTQNISLQPVLPLLQLRRLTFGSRFEEGERVDISPDSSSLGSTVVGSDEEMGMAASTLPLKEKTVDGAENHEEEEDTDNDDKSKLLEIPNTISQNQRGTYSVSKVSLY